MHTLFRFTIHGHLGHLGEFRDKYDVEIPITGISKQYSEQRPRRSSSGCTYGSGSSGLGLALKLLCSQCEIPLYGVSIHFK